MIYLWNNISNLLEEEKNINSFFKIKLHLENEM